MAPKSKSKRKSKARSRSKSRSKGKTKTKAKELSYDYESFDGYANGFGTPYYSTSPFVNSNNYSSLSTNGQLQNLQLIADYQREQQNMRAPKPGPTIASSPQIPLNSNPNPNPKPKPVISPVIPRVPILAQAPISLSIPPLIPASVPVPASAPISVPAPVPARALDVKHGFPASEQQPGKIPIELSKADWADITASGFFVEGPFGMVKMYHPELDKEFYLFADVHKDLNGCVERSEYKQLSFSKFVVNVAKHQSPMEIDLFLEANPHKKEDAPSESGYLFSEVVPFFRAQGCLSRDKTICHSKYPNLRVHYMDLRDNDRSSLLHRLTEIDRLIDFASSLLGREEDDEGDAVKQGFKIILESPLSEESESIKEEYGTLGTFFDVIDRWLNEVLNYAYIDSKSDEPINIDVVLSATPKVAKFSEDYKVNAKQYVLQVLNDNRKRTFLNPNATIPVRPITEELPINEIRTELKSVKTLMQSYLVEDDEEERHEIEMQIFKRFSNVIARSHSVLMLASVIMDLYVVNRMMKPYVKRLFSYMGAAHIHNHIFLLQRFGFQIANAIPKEFTRTILNDATDELFIIPSNYELEQAVYDQKTNQHILKVRDNDKNAIFYVPVAFSYKAQQCLYFASSMFPIFQPLQISRSGGSFRVKPTLVPNLF